MNICTKFDGGKQYNRSQRGVMGRQMCRGRATIRSWTSLGSSRVRESNRQGSQSGIHTGKEANPVFKETSERHTRQVERDMKRKATDEVKKKWMQTKYRKTNDDSLQAQRDYARNDGGQGVRDVPHDVPSRILEDLAVDYYKAHINVSPSRIIEIESSTRILIHFVLV